MKNLEADLNPLSSDIELKDFHKSEIDSGLLFVPLNKDHGQEMEIIRRPSLSYWQDAWLRLKKNKLALVSAGYLVALIACAICIPPFLPYSFDQQEIWNTLSKPSLGREAAIVDADAEPTLLRVVPAPGSGADAPSQVQNVRVIDIPTTVGIHVGWDPVPGAKQYQVFRSLNPESRGIPAGVLNADTVSFWDQAAIQADNDYYYRVVATNSFGEGEASENLKVTPAIALSLTEARKFDPNIKVGEKITSKAHFLGTDYLGRDTFARLLMGARVSLFIGLVAPLLYILIGVIWGSVSGFFGGAVDNIMMRIADLVTTVPELLVVIMLQVVMGSGVTTLIMAMTISLWARSAMQIRGEVLRVREMEYIHAAKILGTPKPKIIFRHVLPNVMGSIIVLFSLAIPQAIFTEAFLSFIGLGIAPPMPSWGSLTREGAKVFVTEPLQLLFPALLMSVTMLAFNLFGDGLRDALDPKLRGAK